MTIKDDLNQTITFSLLGRQAEKFFGYTCLELLSKREYKNEEDFPEEITDKVVFSNSSTDSYPNYHYAPPPPPQCPTALFHPPTTDFTNSLCLPSEDVADLEWLSLFVDDSFTDFPPPELSGSMSLPNDKSFPNRGHTKPMRQAEGSESIRRCTHCASEKTPQWRTGPLGPKTLCNACGTSRVGSCPNTTRGESDVRADSAFELAPEGDGAPSPERGFAAATGRAAAILSSPERVSSLLTCRCLSDV
ncbi:hypothetical protein M0R45_034847 [Rubus argutus]|uniref:GATA-type domain-containing protein n=1 Tax=Rubus argutus TaxID=59490 RepID=A0AAW1VVH8_RUBAR